MDTYHTTTTPAAPASIFFEEYDAKNTPTENEGEAIAKVMYRTEKGEAEKQNYFLRAPAITDAAITEQLTVLMPHIEGMVAKVQEELVKGAHKEGRTSMMGEELGLAAVITKLEATGTGRLNKEKILSWFDSNMADLLTVAFAEKLGVTEEASEEEIARLETITQHYRNNFGALASPKSHFVEDTCEAMSKALEATGADSTVIGARFVIRLEAMSKQVDEVLLAL